MDVLIMIICAVIVLSILVFIHEGGHFLTAKMFGVRVTEFMLGLPGPHVGFKFKGTKFGITCIPLGGYARVCGMEPGNIKPHLPEVLHLAYNYGQITPKIVAQKLNITEDEADDALYELSEWGSLERPSNKDRTSDGEYVYYTPERDGRKKGDAVAVKLDDKVNFFKQEYFCQYRSLSFWKRSIILLSGIFVNLLFAMIIFVILFTLIGFDVQNTETQEISHIILNPLEAIKFGFAYIWAVVCAVVNLFNPATMADTVSHSTSLIGIAVISKSAAEQGIWAFMQFIAMISVSLGIMNLLPIPPLDGGKFLIEIIQRITRRNVPERVITGISLFGILLFLMLFVVMMNQDIQRFVLGN